jgi:hypothetical protein
MKKWIDCQENLNLITIVIIINFLTTSCSESKYAQCEQIIKIANTVAKETKQITKSNNEAIQDMKSWLQAADIMARAAQQLENLPLEDPNLLKYQSTLTKVYRTNSEATYAIIKAWENKDINAAKVAKEDVETAGKLEKELGTMMNAYCLDK